MLRQLLTVFSALLLSLAAFSQEDFSILHGPYLQNVKENEATIVWVTNRKAVAWVELAPDDKSSFYAEMRPRFYETHMGKLPVGTVHKVRLQNLQKATTYRYRIISREVTGEEAYHTGHGEVASTDVFRKSPLKFTTLDPGKTGLHFAMINDIHADSARLSNLLRQVNFESLDFMLFNGDMVSSMENEEQMFKGFLSQAVTVFASETPFFFARGNHEARGIFSSEYLHYFPTSNDKPYYTFVQGGVYFIVLDAGEDKPDNDIDYRDLAAFDDYRREQVEWLKTVTESEEFKQAPLRVVIMHVPPAMEPVGDWYGTLEAKRLFVPLLNKVKIDLMLSGHLHKFAFYDRNDNTGCNFPVLINSHMHVADLTTDNKSISIRIKDGEGKLVKEIKL
ncbi:MAG: metallophosphoesterase [Tannerella sp.]|jgi:predicted MPP superfamily phosphohydrolase|nr:metallophosphoesterase [Tannerella sp.]